MVENIIPAFTKGTQNLLDPEIIAADAAQDSIGWLTKDGKLVLSYGRNVVGNDSANIGKVYGLHFGYKADGTKVMYRKVSTKIQYLKAGTWTDIITGLTATADYSFTNYSSLAGAFTFVFGCDGIWKIINAFPENPIAMYLSTKNFKGKAFIDKGRTILWDRPEDKTGVYGSYIDRQDSTVYTSVSSEVLGASGNTHYTGTLAAGHGGTKNLFGLSVTGTTGAGVETFKDNYDGTLTSDKGGTGTINYVTGAYDITFNASVSTGNVVAAYQWEDSNVKGVTDFTKSATRQAGEGFQFPQDEGGDAILNILIGQDGNYYSEKAQSFYRLALEATDTNADNNIYRKDLGISSFRAGISTNKGIVFINTANPAKPEMTILQKSLVNDNIEPVTLFPDFKFANYDFTDCDINTWERYITVLCRKKLSATNDVILLCDMTTGTVDVVEYAGRCSAKDAGNFYVGHTIIENVYQLFNGFDDMGLEIQNYWKSKNDSFKIERLKKYRKLKIKGTMSNSQILEVYIDCDGTGKQLVGTIRGDGDYVDYNSPLSVGVNMIGDSQIGGSDTDVIAYPYFTELKVKLPKFRVRTIELRAKGIGYLDVQMLSDWDILTFEQRLPTRFRQKQNVSLDGLTDNN